MEDIQEIIDREHAVAARVKERLACGNPVGELKAVAGLDGFIDEIAHVVDKRNDEGHFSRIETISGFAGRIASAAGRSANVEIVPWQVKIGGNGPILANALARLGVRTTYIGNVGYPSVHPVFAGLAEKCDVISIAEPAHTDALEFNDGKILLGKSEVLKEITWKRLVSAVGLDALAAMLDGCDLLALVNWTMIPEMSEIWERIIEEVFPRMKTERRRIAFFDIADPEKRTRQDIKRMLLLLPRFSEKFDVVLGLNEREARQVAAALGMPEHALESKFVNEICEFIAMELDLHCVVVHPVKYAVATVGGAKAGRRNFHQDGPNSARPLITTGAGDNFNAAFCLGLTLGLGADAALLMGVCCSGHYVLTGRTPKLRELTAFMESWRERMDEQNA